MLVLVGGTRGSTYSLREMILSPVRDRDPGAKQDHHWCSARTPEHRLLSMPANKNTEKSQL